MKEILKYIYVIKNHVRIIFDSLIFKNHRGSQKS